VTQPADLLLRQTLEAPVALPLDPDPVFILAVNEADGSQGEAEQLESEVDGVADVEFWRVCREICPPT